MPRWSKKPEPLSGTSAAGKRAVAKAEKSEGGLATSASVAAAAKGEQDLRSLQLNFEADFDRWEGGVVSGLLRRADRRADRKKARELRRELDSDRHLRRAVTAEAVTRYSQEGGDLGDWQSFMQWVLDHADELIAFIQKIIALFSV